MTKTTYQNEQLKRAFFTYLHGARGFADTSLRSFAEAIWQWQLFTGGEDFTTFNQEKATAFKEWLTTRPTKTKAGRLSLATQSNYDPYPEFSHRLGRLTSSTLPAYEAIPHRSGDQGADTRPH